MNLREQAALTYQAFQAEQDLEEFDRRNEIAQTLTSRIIKAFHVDPDRIDIDTSDPQVVAIVDDLRFVLTGHSHSVALLGACPTCKDVCRSRPIQSLCGLGEMLDTFEPDYDHRCSTPTEETTPTDRLVQALRDLIDTREE